MDLNNLKETVVSNQYLHNGFKVLLILIAAFIITKIINLTASKFFKRLKNQNKSDPEYSKRIDTFKTIFNYIYKITLYTVVGIIILGELGIEIGPILAAAGVVGVAVGFGAQTLVKDVINGMFIFIQDQLRVGDWVEMAGKEGEVEDINLKMTRLRDISGNVHFIPNGEIKVVTNKTRDFSKYVYNIGVAYKENVDQVMEIMREVHRELQEDPEYKDDILEPINILGLDKFGDSAIVIKAVSKTKPLMHRKVGREYKRRLKNRFDKDDIEIPFPHLTLYYGQDTKKDME